MTTSNYSVSNEKAHSLPPRFKWGVVLFLSGVILLIQPNWLSQLTGMIVALTTAVGLLFAGSILFTFQSNAQLYLVNPSSKHLNGLQFAGWAFALLGIGILSGFWSGLLTNYRLSYLIFSLGSIATGISCYTWGSYVHRTSGVKNNAVYFRSLTSSGIIGWITGILLTLFYIQLYWHVENLVGLIRLFDPLSVLLRGKIADQWFTYGTLYTFVILFLGLKFMVKYRHNRYQLIRTTVVIGSQLIFAYIIPQVLESLHYNSSTSSQGEFLGYFNTNPTATWPLHYDFFSENSLRAMTHPAYQPVGTVYLIWGIVLFLIVTPVLTYWVGKRWYCSWICGCGGLAETAGDSFRQLSSKSTIAWKIERWVIHSVMVLVLLMTLSSLIPYFTKEELRFGQIGGSKTVLFLILALFITASLMLYRAFKKWHHLGLLIGLIASVSVLLLFVFSYFSGSEYLYFFSSYGIKKWYGFFIGATFSGVIGVGFYPVLGNRIWCRFGCPMAGYMGLFQRFKSRFRVTTNGGQCISCGNCSTYCEQGIDVRAYAQRQENIVRSSCVGCGICSVVCPRGVLKLENGPEDGRFLREKLSAKPHPFSTT